MQTSKKKKLCGDELKSRWKSLVLRLIRLAHHQRKNKRAAEHHRLLSSTLYMAKPNTANTVAPTLTLSQRVEFLRSAWLTCLFNREGDAPSQSLINDKL